MMKSLLNEIVLRRWKDEAGLVKHVQISRNHGLLGGLLQVTFYTHPSGDATGISESEILYPPAPPAGYGGEAIVHA